MFGSVELVKKPTIGPPDNEIGSKTVGRPAISIQNPGCTREATGLVVVVNALNLAGGRPMI